MKHHLDDGANITAKVLRNSMLLVTLFLIVGAGTGFVMSDPFLERFERGVQKMQQTARRVSPPKVPRTEPQFDTDRELVYRAGPNGHFWLTAQVNGVDIRFIVDTGASNVAISNEDARRIGLTRGSLRYDRQVNTANGVVSVAPVVLREIRIGQFSARDVTGSVSKSLRHVSLLGMSFLRQLNGYEVRGDRLVLRW